MSELSDDQVADLLAWAKDMMEVHAHETTSQIELMYQLTNSIDKLPPDQRTQIALVSRQILHTMQAFHEGFKRAPSFIQRPENVVE